MAAVSGLLCVLTLVSRDWFEVATGYNPDRHSGSAEWAIVGALLVATLLFSLLARTQWSNHRPVVPVRGH
jgi:hypothetical protein